jgi:hypothetical protein
MDKALDAGRIGKIAEHRVAAPRARQAASAIVSRN